MIGPKDNLDKIKTILDKKVKGSFEVVLRDSIVEIEKVVEIKG